MKHRWPLLAGTTALAIALIVMGSRDHDPELVGRPMPELQLTRADGSNWSLADLRGQVVVLNLWATWCPPCEEETPDLVDLYEKYKDKEVEFLGISIDEQGRSVVNPFVKKYDVNYPITIDDGTIMDKYGPLMGVPTTYLIDKEGNLRYFATGAVTKKEIELRLEKLLEE
jgi:peroxiredoxin